MKRILLTLSLLLAFLQISISSNYIQVSSTLYPRKPDIFYLPSSSVLHALALDYDDFLADLIWVKTILYFAEEFLGNQDYRYLEVLLNIITDLDPRFERAYIWSGAAFIYNARLIKASSVEASNRILKKGWDFYNESLVKWKVGDDFWRIPFTIGFNYSIELKDKKSGAPYYQAAAQFPQTPEYIRTLAATLYRKTDAYDQAMVSLEEQLTLENLQQSLKFSSSDEQKQELMGKIQMIYKQAAQKNISLSNRTLRRERNNRLFKSYVKNYAYLPLSFYQLLYEPDSSN